MRFKTLREIIYVNPDDFYASVVRVKDPALRSRPVVVGYLSSRGVVVGASYEAREAGVRAGITIAQARRICPEAAFVHVDWELFRRVSRGILDVACRYSPFVEPVGLDELFMDYTGCSRLFGNTLDLAVRLKREISFSLSLDVSLGVSTNKLVSQIASRAAKLAGLVQVPPGGEREFLAGFPVEWLPGIGRVRARLLALMGVRRIGTLAEIPVPFVERAFGPIGKTLVERARGVDDRPVLPGVGGEFASSVTFPEDEIRVERLESGLYRLVEDLARKLRFSSRAARRIRLHLGYTDGYMISRSGSFKEPTVLDRDIFGVGVSLLRGAFTRRVKVRSLRLEVTSAVPFVETLEMFERDKARFGRLYRACDRVRDKYGWGKVLSFGRTFKFEDVSGSTGNSPETPSPPCNRP